MQRFVTLAALCMMLAGAAVAQTLSGTITSNETWSGTITVTGDVVVTSGILTIAAGTVIKFAASSDNVVLGSSSQISLAVMQDGAIQANGTQGSRITFTSASPLPAKGAWSRVDVQALKNTNPTWFKYCDFEYAKGACIEMRNPAGYNEVAKVTIENCTFKNFTSSGIYITSNGELDISYSSFDQMGSSGIFLHGSGAVNVNYCTISNCPTGIINAGDATYPNQVVKIDHLTMYNIDMMLTDNPKWWTGYGIFHTNDVFSGSSVTNSILVMSTLANMKLNGWSIDEHHNCWDTGMFGLMNIEDGTPDATSLVGDLTNGNISPLFTDAAGGDFSLAAGSPCLNAASDGKHMGAWQGTAGIHDDMLATDRNTIRVAVTQNPMRDATTIVFNSREHAVVNVFSAEGIMVRSLTNTDGVNSITWDGRDSRGARVAPGMYFYRLTAGGSSCHSSLIVTR